MKRIGIYKITNPTGKVYIGQSLDIDARFLSYKNVKRKEQALLFNSLRKYGYENHQFEVLKECMPERLNELERAFIFIYKSNEKSFGLNLTDGGRDYFNHNDEVKARMSVAQTGNTKTLGRKQSLDEINKRVDKLKGQRRNAEQKKRMSDAKKGVPISDSHRANIGKGSLYRGAKCVIDTVSLIVYKRVGDAADAFGFKKSTLTAMLNGQSPNKTNLKYL